MKVLLNQCTYFVKYLKRVYFIIEVYGNINARLRPLNEAFHKDYVIHDLLSFYYQGQVTDLKDVIATQIALGKAHTVVLTDRGQVYTFGINNKGQCGRDFMPGGNKEGQLSCYQVKIKIDSASVICVV